MRIIKVFFLIMGMTSLSYAGSRKSPQPKKTTSQCEKDKKACQKRNRDDKKRIDGLNREKSSLSSTNSRLRNDAKKLNTEVGRLKSEKQVLNDNLTNLKKKKEIENKNFSFDNFIYCKCHGLDINGKIANCNFSENWLCNSTRSTDDDKFKVMREKVLSSCISENIKNFISLQGHWLKSQMKSLYNIEVSQWDDCQKSDSLKNMLSAEDQNVNCGFLRVKLKEFLLSDNKNSFYGNRLCVKGISKDELM
jgi:hypothetical protein